MNILVTGACGFIGKNLVLRLENPRKGCGLEIGGIYKADRETSGALFEEYAQNADFVFHLAGANRPEREGDFKRDNVEYTKQLLEALKKAGKRCPLVFASSIRAGENSLYGQTKAEAERLVSDYAAETGANVCLYRLPNVFGKWCRPFYNSVVATFCRQLALGASIELQNPESELTLLYIDDLVKEFFAALAGAPRREAGLYCSALPTYKTSVGALADKLRAFAAERETVFVPELPPDSLDKKLYSTYLSYLPPEKAVYGLAEHVDKRGVFATVLQTGAGGQLSVVTAAPGQTRGGHWHNSKWEIFVVICGHGRICQRSLDSGESAEYEVRGEELRAVRILPGCVHSLENLGAGKLVALIWANEAFDPENPDTFSAPS